MHWVNMKPEAWIVWILRPPWLKNCKGMLETQQNFSRYLCDRIKLCESNKIKDMFHKHTPLKYVAYRWLQTEWWMKHELVNYLKALSQFETKIAILAVKRKCNRSTLTILPSIQFIESNNSDIYSLEITNIVFYAFGFHHLIYFTFKFSEHVIEFTISFPYCVSIAVVILNSPNVFDLIIWIPLLVSNL